MTDTTVPDPRAAADDTDDAVLPAHTRTRIRRVAWLYLIVSVGLLPWIVLLAVSLPGRNLDLHYRLSWVGFDCFLVLALARTAYMAFRLDPRVQFPATVSAALLAIDAWFDITTAGDRASFVEAVILAVVAELPAAALSLYVAHRVNKRVLHLAHLDLVRAGAAPEPPP
ncbi:MAG: hypothetical protein ACRDZP_05195 [Acidimicrobiales bacterium]